MSTDQNNSYSNYGSTTTRSQIQNERDTAYDQSSRSYIENGHRQGTKKKPNYDSCLSK